MLLDNICRLAKARAEIAVPPTARDSARAPGNQHRAPAIYRRLGEAPRDRRQGATIAVSKMRSHATRQMSCKGSRRCTTATDAVTLPVQEEDCRLEQYIRCQMGYFRSDKPTLPCCPAHNTHARVVMPVWAVDRRGGAVLGVVPRERADRDLVIEHVLDKATYLQAVHQRSCVCPSYGLQAVEQRC